jgi:hypothetical protein
MLSIEQIEAALAEHELRLLIARCAIVEYKFKVKTKSELLKKVNEELRSKKLKEVSWGYVYKHS